MWPCASTTPLWLACRGRVLAHRRRKRGRTLAPLPRVTPRRPLQVLGLSADPAPGDDDIRRAKRELSLQTHPDKTTSPGATAAFRLVTAAAQTLLDPAARATYDRGMRAHAASRSRRGMHSTAAAQPPPEARAGKTFHIQCEHPPRSSL